MLKMIKLKKKYNLSKDKNRFNGQRIFEVLKFPVVTEKSTQFMSFNRYVFKVAKDATKLDIKNSVETIFNVTVISVNTLNQIPRKKKFRGRVGFSPSYKKASVRLKSGDTIDLGLKV